ncbi:pilus assembly protein PilZ [Sphingomonas sp. Leaf412]|uniref:PilZ domain-containing protein n=1 Tax=Sphingomonas sp. Leaf412 TaxID=1736370 RepID=UPI0006F32152|nr:PilZ domain-containing protein [Sphingomonas sp. Leaf412]KQT32515.1 pilus assembly protein PilZ [Sphingomonas sp. Leaf412]
MFAAEFEPAVDDSRRRTARAAVVIDAAADVGPGAMTRALCKVLDVSQHGCRLQTYSALRRGSAIWLNMPGVGAIAADVIWVNDFIAGCQFRHALDPAALADLATRHA